MEKSSSAAVLVGAKFGRWTIIEIETVRNKCRYVKCICECGEISSVRLAELKNGNSSSCGCLKISIFKNNSTKHGLYLHPLYNVLDGMKQRCVNKNHESYRNYGERGISVCDQWTNDFKKFVDWALENGWKKGLEIDRINNELGYFPENCRFVSHGINMRNTRRNIMINFFGKTQCLKDWCIELGLSYKKTNSRMRELKWTAERALTTK